MKNPHIANYHFLAEMFEDSYYPNALVEQGKNILLTLCRRIEEQQPQTLAAFYVLTHEATEAFNALQEAFWEQDSEIETMARECIGADFRFIAKAYDFDADIEEIIAPRDW